MPQAVAGADPLDRARSHIAPGAAVTRLLEHRLTIVALSLLALLLASTLFVYLLSKAAEDAVAQNAERVSIAWAQFFGSNFDDLANRLESGSDFREELAIFERTREFADVFRIKLFDGEGRLLMISDEAVAKADAGSLAEHNPKAYSVIHDGKPLSFVEDGRNKPNRPDVYVESYVPLTQNGNVVGVAEVYLDETLDAANIRARYFTFGAVVGGLVLFVLAFPIAVLLLTRRSLKARNLELTAARDAAREAEKSKSEFLAMMSHELRTPMNAVIGFANLLGQSELNGLQREFVETIQSSSETLLSLLNDVLDFSKIEAGRIELEDVDLSPVELVDGILDLFGPSAYAKGLELSSFIDPALPAEIVGDPGRLRQILFNLVGNAVKFTSQGAVSIELHRLGEEFEIAVTDTGIGIEPAKVDEIFERFTQADNSTSRRYGGTGLGLAISRRLVELMGGRLSVDSEPGKGSTFRARLPLVETEPPADALVEHTDADIAGRRVLVVDDNEANRRILTLLLEAFGARADAAADAHQAMSMLFTAIREGKPFDVAFIDHMMPDVDGYQFATMIRSESALNDLRMILSSSAHLATGEYENHAGFDGRCPKPVRQATLLSSIDQALRHPAASEAPVPPPPPSPATPETTAGSSTPQTGTRLLIAEDNVTNQRLMQAVLGGRGYSIDMVSNGAEAVQQARTLPYDVLLLDVSMPEMGGLEAAERIRTGKGRNADTPIIAITANAMKGDREKCLAAGMNDYLSKPIDTNDLLGKLTKWVASGRQATASTGT